MVIERDILPLIPCESANTRSTNNKGYTLVELLVVCTIIGILSTIAIPTFSDVRKSVKVARSISEINGLEKEIIGYAVEKGDFPVETNWIALIHRDGTLDPWGNPYVYKRFVATEMRNAGGVENGDFDLFSLGEDGLTSADLTLDAPESKDDVVRFSEGGYIGLAGRF